MSNLMIHKLFIAVKKLSIGCLMSPTVGLISDQKFDKELSYFGQSEGTKRLKLWMLP